MDTQALVVSTLVNFANRFWADCWQLASVSPMVANESRCVTTRPLDGLFFASVSPLVWASADGTAWRWDWKIGL